MKSVAKEISGYYKRLMAEIKDELRRSEEENQKKQRTLDQILSPRVLLQRLCPDQGLPQDVPEPLIKEEPEWSVKQEEEELPE